MGHEDDSPRDVRRRRSTIVRGTIGVVPDLWEVWTSALDSEGISWRKLADNVGYTRSYIQLLCENETIPWNAFAKVSRALGLTPEALIERVKDGK